jgi:hypothetical protein
VGLPAAEGLQDAGATLVRTRYYILVIVKCPAPVQPELPVRFQFPVIELPVTVPLIVSVFPPGDPDFTVIPNAPETLPLKFPPSVNEPVAVSPVTKHGEFVEKFRLVTLSDPFDVCVIEVLNDSVGLLFASIKVAVQLPLIFPELLLLVPQPTRSSPTANMRPMASFCMRKHSCVDFWSKLAWGWDLERDAERGTEAVRRSS